MPELNPKEQLILKVRQKWDLQVFQAHLAANLPQSLLGAIICVESAGYKQAVRFEIAYFKLIYNSYKLNGIDCLLSSSSHGACQIMGFHSQDYKCLSKLKNGTKCGTLNYSISDFYERPIEVCAAFIHYNAYEYVKNQDWESIARIYNGGSSNNKLTDPYWQKIKDYMTLYELSLKNMPSLEKVE